MSYQWFRSISMATFPNGDHNEIWSLKGDARNGKSYQVQVRYGKPVDILSLKAKLLHAYEGEISQIRETRTNLYASPDLERVTECPICKSASAGSVFRLKIYGARYHQCPECNHCYVVERPGADRLNEFYNSDAKYAATYTDPENSRKRLQEVAIPKASWAVELFRNQYGRNPKRVLDIGAGGGHFVFACLQMGINAQGIEISRENRRFAKEMFALNLQADDFLSLSNEGEYDEVELITFWGVLEHVPKPIEFLRQANRLLSRKEALVIAEVPRWESLSTSIQSTYPDSVMRHLDPLGHIHCFTDNSLATAFKLAGFGPVAAWYFGMDAYEMFTQFIYHSSNSAATIHRGGELIGNLQSYIDAARLSDEIVLAGRPE